MPLRAVCHDTNVFAYDCTAQQWADLKASYKETKLRMPCCSSEAIPKTSRLGTFFFAHTQKGNCTTAPESAEHLFVKALVARAATSVGWSVTTEWSGETPDGEQWIADVYCQKGKARVALEVQMSYQTPAEMYIRQKRYKKSGVRCCWFLSSTAFKAGYSSAMKDAPFFFLSPVEVGKEPQIKQFAVGIADFIKGILTGRLSWEKIPSEYEILYLDDLCYKCHSPTRQVYGYVIGVYGEEAKTAPNASNVLESMMDFISNEDLKQLGLNTVGRFDQIKGQVINFPYCNICIYCRARQNNFYLLEKLNGERGRDSKSLGSAMFLKDEGYGKWLFNP